MAGRRGPSPGSQDPGPAYIFFRIVQIVTLIVMWSLLASVVAQYNHAGIPVPGSILCLFIVGILLTAWSFCILLTYLQARNVDYLIAFFDIVGMVALIVGVALLSNAVNNECINVKVAAQYAGTDQQSFLQFLQNNSIGLVSGGQYGAYCSILKAAWGLGIANILFFFLTAIQGYQIAQAYDAESKRLRRGSRVREVDVVEERVIAAPVIVETRGDDRPKRKKSSHKHKSSRDKEKRRSSRADYYGP